MNNTFKIRWAQLDVARQKENIEFIEQYIVLLEESGYNGLLLYLEDRIKTAAYPYCSDHECYTADEIRHIVSFAAAHQLEVIPCVATLGHAERFLRHKELAHLAEVQDNMTGRFGGTDKETFCITHPDFYKFMDAYLLEVSELFPSGWFHVGLDEFYDYNLCPRCRNIMKDLAAEQQMFLQHIRHLRDLFAAQGKRIIMWSDMFEFYPDVFKSVPPDVVMTDWQYQRDVRHYQGHLLDAALEERLQVNAACGFQTIIAPADRTLSNSQSFCEYASGKEGVLGGLMTSWEKNDTYLYRMFPLIASFGFQMNGMERGEAFAAAVNLIFHTDDPVFSAVLQQIYNTGQFCHFNGLRENRIFSCDYYGLKSDYISCVETAFVILRNSLPEAADERARRCLTDFMAMAEDKVFSVRFQVAAQNIFTFGAAPEHLKEFAMLRSRYSSYLERMKNFWNCCRNGITPNVLSEKQPAVEQSLAAMEEQLATDNWIALSGCLPDGFGVEKLQIEFMHNGQWQQAACGVFKPLDEFTALFTRYIPLKRSDLTGVEAVRLSAWGLGGLGITFVKFKLNGRYFVPGKIISAENIVIAPENMLEENTSFAWLGDQSVRRSYFDRTISELRHSITCSMQEFSTGDLVFCQQ